MDTPASSESVDQSTNAVIASLGALAQWDTDAETAYNQALRRVNVRSINDHMRRFHADHGAHVRELCYLLRKYGGAPQVQKDERLHTAAFLRLRDAKDTKNALYAMLAIELSVLQKYEEATDWDLPADCLTIIKMRRDDEVTHVNYLTECIENKLWETDKHPELQPLENPFAPRAIDLSEESAVAL